MPRSAYAALVSMTVLFGASSFVVTKYALRGFNPLLLALVRFTFAGAILWLIWRWRGDSRVRRPGDMRRLAPLGLISLTVYFSLEITGIAHTSASSAAILIATIPVFVSIINAALRRERNSAAEWAGIVLSFAGVAALVRLGSGGDARRDVARQPARARRGAGGSRLSDHGARAARRAAALCDDLPEPLWGALHGAAPPRSFLP